jgi:hypothetical protein
VKRTPLENSIGSVVIYDCPHADNLAIALCIYFEDHMDRPENDPETEHGWGEWVEARCDEAIRRIAQAASATANAKGEGT